MQKTANLIVSDLQFLFNCSNIINLFKKSLYDLDYSGTIKINRNENFINFNEENTIVEGVYI